MNYQEIYNLTLVLRQKKRFSEAFDVLCREQENSNNLTFLKWQHQPFFWEPLISAKVTLVREDQSHREFLKSLWENEKFMHDYHRLAPPLHQNDLELASFLDKKHSSILQENSSVQWIICDAHMQPKGVVSLNDISLAHKKAELMIGVVEGTPFYIAPSAALLALDFFFSQMYFEKIYSYVFSDNQLSIKSTEHLGFKKEGYLREHVLNPKTLVREDIIQFGALKSDILTSSNQRLKIKLGNKNLSIFNR